MEGSTTMRQPRKTVGVMALGVVLVVSGGAWGSAMPGDSQDSVRAATLVERMWDQVRQWLGVPNKPDGRAVELEGSNFNSVAGQAPQEPSANDESDQGGMMDPNG